MGKKIFVFYFLTCVFETGFGQNPLVKMWDKRLGGIESDWITFFQCTADGGYILGGSSYSPVSGDKTQDHWGQGDYWIVKTDSLGNKQWDKRFGGTQTDNLMALQQTSDGGYILGGYSASGIGGDKTQAVWGGFYSDYWIIKTDSLGNKEWDRDFGGTNVDNLYSLQQTIDGGYLLGGYSLSDSSGDKTEHTRGGQDYWIIKTDSLGVKQWDKRFGGSLGDWLYSLDLTSDGGFILGGYSHSGNNGDKTQTTWDTATNFTFRGDYWIVKTNSFGIKQWDKDLGGSGPEELNYLHETPDKGFILGGWSASGISGDKTQASWNNSYDFWIVKTDSAGNKQWDKDYGGTSNEDEFGNIFSTLDGGYIISGTSYSSISGDKTEDNLGIEQSWIVKTDSLGFKQWDKTLHTDGHDEIGLTFQTDDGCYTMVNSTSAGIGGDKTQSNWDTLSPISLDFWIIRFCDSTATIVSNFQHPPSGFNIFPNPAKDFINISFTLKEEKNVSVEVYDLLGRPLTPKDVPKELRQSKQEMKIDMRSFPKGVYLIEIKTEEGIYRNKVVKE